MSFLSVFQRVNFVSFNYLTHFNQPNTVLNILTIAIFQAASIFPALLVHTGISVAPQAPTTLTALDGGTGGWTGDIAALDGGTGGWTGDID